jgi:hypothetical protein
MTVYAADLTFARINLLREPGTPPAAIGVWAVAIHAFRMHGLPRFARNDEKARQSQ